jgi:hypothetical protein
MWFVDQLEGSVKYHLPTVIRVEGDFDKDALSLALKAVIRRLRYCAQLFMRKMARVIRSS